MTGAWPRRAVTGGLAALASSLVVQEYAAPGWTGHGTPTALGVATLAVAALVRRHSRGLDRLAGATWRGFAAIALLLALGQLIRGASGVGVNPLSSGPSDLPLAVTGPVAVVVCVRLVRSTRGRVRPQVALDAAVALLALAVLLEAFVPVALRQGASDPLITVGYPLVGSLLCAVGLVTFGAVSPPRRPAAAWLLLCFAALTVTVAAGALAAGAPSPLLDAVTSTAYVAMLGTATLALATDPGPRSQAAEPVAEVPLAGVVVSVCLAFGAALLLLGGWAAGRTPATVEVATLAALLALTFARTLVWAADGARLTRQLLRTEAYFRSLVHRSADITYVLDGQGRITWVSEAEPGPSVWPPRDLQGRPLSEFVHPDDRHELHRALDPDDPHQEPHPVFRLRTRNGGWRQVEAARTVSSAGLAGGPMIGSVPGGGEGLVLHVRDVAGRRSSELELERLAYTDYLTGLPNRARLMSALDAARTRAAAGEPSGVLLVDLDGFKTVNDVAGHEAGDRLLQDVARQLREGACDGDLVARLGGDEFAVLVRGDAAEAAALAERLVARLDRSYRLPSPAGEGTGPLVAVSGSIGIAEIGPHDDAAGAIRQADVALRAAKAAGKNRVRSAGEAVDESVARRSRLVRDLPRALREGQFRLVYQPVVGIAERRVLGLEALVRWEHPVLGTVPPDEFIGLAEDDGLVVPLQRWVLETATRDVAGLLAGGRDLKIGVNISVRHLQAGCLLPDVAAALAGSGLDPRRLMIEITESVMLDGEARLESDLATLHEMGCIVSIDDFGRGWSSLAYLARLPADVLKMDREFVAGVEDDARGAALVRSVIDLGRALGMDVVAEGVETTGQLATLQEMGCRFVQGYLLGRPVPVDALPEIIDSFDPGLLDGRVEPVAVAG